METSLISFVEAAWPIIDPSEYLDHWVLRGICEHLEAVVSGDIRRALFTIPPRCSKTNIVSICFVAWVWAQSKKTFTSGPGVRFLCGSYNKDLAFDNATKCRQLIMSEWYQSRWGNRFRFWEDQNMKSNFVTNKGGARFSSSVGGTLIGKGYDIAIIDDPHNTQVGSVESDADRNSVEKWVKEILGTRQNDWKRSVFIGVMQRMHMNDMIGYILKNHNLREWINFMVPMRYDKSRHCVTVLKRDTAGKPVKAWQDPRKIDGELMWPERFGLKEIADAERELGPAMASGRLQQAPEPAGGGIIKRHWWQLWEGNYPSFNFILGVVDTAYTEKEQNDPSAMTIWGVFSEPKSGLTKVMLIYAWEGRKELPELVDTVEVISNSAVKKTNGHADIPSFPIDHLVIEDKASGKSVAQQLHKLYGNLNRFSVELVTPDKWGDKIARVYAVQHLFADKMIYAGARKENEVVIPRSFAKMVIDQMAVFPYSENKDLTDTASMALLYLRQTGRLERKDERAAREVEDTTYKKQLAPLYSDI